MADSSFERVWAFSDPDLWHKVYAAAGQPPTVQVDPHDVYSGVYGEYLGVYTVPRQAPAVDLTGVEAAAQMGAATGAAAAINGATIHAAP